MGCTENWTVALTVYYWNWAMFADDDDDELFLIYKKEMDKSKRALA